MREACLCGFVMVWAAAGATASPAFERETRLTAVTHESHDFDFFVGEWHIVNRRLVRRGVGSREWDEFPATATGRRLLDGRGHMDEMAVPAKGFSGITLRLYDPAQRQWSLYWVNSLTGMLFPPVVGRFSGGRGVFYGNDEDNGKPVRVRFTWSDITADSAHWEQAFSTDGGKTWETNWTMDFTRVK